MDLFCSQKFVKNENSIKEVKKFQNILKDIDIIVPKILDVCHDYLSFCKKNGDQAFLRNVYPFLILLQNFEKKEA